MAVYRRVYDSHHLQVDYQEPGSAPEPYARQSSIGYLYLFTLGGLLHSVQQQESTQWDAVLTSGVHLMQHTIRPLFMPSVFVREGVLPSPKLFFLRDVYYIVGMRTNNGLQCFDAVGWAAGRAPGL